MSVPATSAQNAIHMAESTDLRGAGGEDRKAQLAIAHALLAIAYELERYNDRMERNR